MQEKPVSVVFWEVLVQDWEQSGGLQAVWPRTGNITSLSFSFHIYKVQTVIDTLQLTVRIKLEFEYKDYGAFHIIMIIDYKYIHLHYMLCKAVFKPYFFSAYL